MKPKSKSIVEMDSFMDAVFFGRQMVRAVGEENAQFIAELFRRTRPDALPAVGFQLLLSSINDLTSQPRRLPGFCQS